jgi:hypothetical protein
MASRQVQWRRFAFFEKETLSEDLTLELGAQVTCLAAAAGNSLLLGDESGKLAVSSDSFASEQRTQRKVFQGSVQAVAAAGGLIWAVGTDAPSASELATVVKAWSDTALESLVLTLNTSVHHSSPAALTAFAVSSDATQAALGFADGTVLLYQSQQANVPLHKVTVPPPQVIRPSPVEPSGVTALHFSEKQYQTKLFVCYEEKADGARTGAGQ